MKSKIERRGASFNLICVYREKRYRGIVQLVEYRSPKPQVVGSSPTAPGKQKSQETLIPDSFFDFSFFFMIPSKLPCP